MRRSFLGSVFPLFLGALPHALAEDSWKIQFQYNKPDSVFDIRDLACPSAERCIGAGAISDVKGRVKGATVVTSDGGAHWTLEDFADEPVALFFLKETAQSPGAGWMAAQHGIWKTDEGGRSWKKIAALKGIVQLYFLDAAHGYAVGYPKAIYETTDGGVTWEKLAAAQSAPGKPDDEIYESVAFSGQHGIIIGRVLTERYRQYPVWMVPEAERSRQQQKESATLTLQTFDGGKTWKYFGGGFVGNISEVRFANDDQVLALVEYRDMYALPSAVIKMKLGSPGNRTIFAEKDRAVCDLAVFADGGALMAAVEPPGNTNQVPVPGKLKMLRSHDLKLWEEMDVDYRAEAQRAIIAAPDSEHAWVATDVGMVLALESKSADSQKHLR
jgi:Photosynthesis system II assembly factor YCF48